MLKGKTLHPESRLSGSRSSIVVFCMPERGHMQRVLPVINSIARRGRPVHVVTDARFAPLAIRAGGTFVDMFEEGPIDDVDGESAPVPSRYVTFAARRATAVARRIAALSPGVIVYDTFAVIARVVASVLGVPSVNVCACHAMVPSRAVAAMACDPRVRTSRACAEAVAELRGEYGMRNASPFSYLDGVSSLLNLYGEPAQFLRERDRAELEPIAFFGSLAPNLQSDDPGPSPFRTGRSPRIYVSFGSVAWRYFSPAAEAVLDCISGALAHTGADVLLSTAGHALATRVAAKIACDGHRVESSVDQWAVLRHADLFITHQGLNSTHESIWQGVPMLSCPFFADQPALAQRCSELGLASTLWPGPGHPIDQSAFRACIERTHLEAARFRDRLADARTWEQETIAGRDAIVDRLLGLG